MYIENVHFYMLAQVNYLPVGCSLGYHRTNILCCADDIVLLAPSSEGLQILIDKVCSMLQDLNLIINLEKTVQLVVMAKANLIIISVVSWSGRP